ncbi:hypothetical protein LCGC14_2525600, partial [marine sediment metagenome]
TGTDQYAINPTGSGTDTLTFRYTIQSGDVSPDLDYKAVDSLEFNGGTIRDTGNTVDADRTLPAPGAAGSLGYSRNIVVNLLEITGSTLASDNSYVDVTFSAGVYNTGGGSGALEDTDFSITFNANSGTATGALITGVTKTDGNPLAGGETVIRVNISIIDDSSGVETVEIKPADSTSIYNGAGNAALNTETTGQLTLNALGWYDSYWSYRIKITLDGTKVTGNVTDFPYLVYLASNASLAANARSDVGFEGFDILFTSDDGATKLDHEIEKYVTGTGELVAWVEIPSMSAGVDTDIYMYYGYASAPDQSNAAGVWDGNYKAVYHLNEAVTDNASATGAHLDSTANNNDGDQYNNSPVTGKIANGQDLEGDVRDEYIEIPNSVSLENIQEDDYTIEAWFNADQVPPGANNEYNGSYGIVVRKGWNTGLSFNSFGYLKMEHLLTGEVEKEVQSNTSKAAVTWYHLVGVVSRTSGFTKIWVDGVLQSPTNNWT